MTARLLCLLIAFSVLSGAAHGTPIEVDVPAYPVWCTTATMHPSSNGGGDQGGDLVNKLTQILSDEARDKKMLSIGLPFVAAIAKTTGAGQSNDVDVTVCAAVPQDAAAPGAKVIARTEPHRKGLAQVCDNTGLDACSDVLEAALKTAPWQLDQSALDAATRREHPALTTDGSADNAVKSLLYTKDIVLGGPATEDTLSSLKTGKVVVAILVDVQEPPASAKGM